MRKLTLLAALMLSGCTTQPTTDDFYIADAAIAKECEALSSKDDAKDVKVDPVTGRSLATDVAICYEKKIWTAVYASGYKNAELVEQFAKHLVLLNRARDAGNIDLPAYIYISERNTSIERFKTLIVRADSDRNRQDMKAFSDKLAIFAGQMSALSLQRDAQRAAARSTNTICSPLGPFNNTSLYCTTR